MNDSTTIPAIEVCDVTKWFGAVQALNRVSFQIAKGELFFLLGPSGCGKTTLLRILAGLEMPDSGTILFDGADIRNKPPHLRGAPMVFQNYSLWPHLTVRENTAFGLVERGIRRDDARRQTDEALRRVDLQAVSDRMPGQLSGGQQQRVALARALVLNPQVVLLDEPLSNLDAKLRAEMREEIERLHAGTDITFVYVTHDQIEALTLADRMAVMKGGQISAAGSPHDLYHRPPNRFCAEFLGEAILIPAQIRENRKDGVSAVLDTALGIWEGVLSPSAAGAATGTQVYCFIRPENLHPAGTQLDLTCNSFEGLVNRVRMNGATITVLMEAAGQELRATVLNQYGFNLQAGRKTRWEAAKANTIILGA